MPQMLEGAFCKTPLSECTRELVEVAQGRRPADVVVRNAALVNVLTAEILKGTEVAIACGRVAYVGDDASHCIGEGTEVIDAGGLYLAPGFLDGHIHVESSMMGAGEYARAVVPHGTVGIYMDPHEICNVLGFEGIRVMLDDAARAPLKTMLTTPSCVPAVPGFEDTGSSMDAEQVAMTMEWPETVGLGEMMNFVGVLASSDLPHDEIIATLKADRTVTGHYSMPETDRGLNAYISSGIRCCHESTRPEDVIAKMRLGMYAHLRYGSAWQDLPEIASAITSRDIDTRMACLVSDDTHPHTIVEHGHLDHILSTAVSCGIDPIAALQMVTINCAQCFGMDADLGSISPGRCADMVILEDLESFRVKMTMIDGEVVARDGKPLFELEPFEFPSWSIGSMNVGYEIEESHLAVKAPKSAGDGVVARVIEVIPGKTITREAHCELPVRDGEIAADPENDVLKAVVFERHHATGTRGYGFVKGFGIRNGALASTVAHDAHNLLVVGSNDADMALAANTLAECGGGMVAVSEGRVLGLVELPIAGLMDDLDAESLSAKVGALQDAWKSIGCTMPSPFMTMALIPLACLPELRLTNRGLVDCNEFEFVDLLVEQQDPAQE